jgi:hypothetical protein
MSASGLSVDLAGLVELAGLEPATSWVRFRTIGSLLFD